MSVYRKDDNGNIKKIAGSLTQRINMHIFQTTHEFDTEKNEDNYIINESDAKPYISSIKDWTQYSINLSEPNESSNINIKLGSQTLKLINSVKNIEIGTLKGVIQCHTEKLDNNEIFLNVVGTVVSLNGVEKTSINTDTTPTANSNNLITSGGVHDYPAIAFAESERQKSKNLLNKDLLKKGCYIFVTGQFDYNSEYMTSEPISVTPNSTITVSCNGFIFDSNCGFVFFNNGVFVGYVSNGATVATVPANANQVIYNFYKVDITKDDLQYAQLEYGSVATDYQPYYGQITRSGDKEIEFAENEYQKSKNLFNALNVKMQTELSYNENTNTFTYTVNKTLLSGDTAFVVIQFGYLDAGTYTVSFQSTSSVVDNENGYTEYIISKLNQQGYYESSIFTSDQLAGYNTITFTISERLYVGMLWYYKRGWIAGDTPAGNKTLKNIQVEYGSVATDYQPYNGQISHTGDKEIEFAENEYQKSKNLIPYPYHDGNSIVSNGITFTVNNDQSISVSGAIVDHNSNAVMWLAWDIPLKAGTYRISDSNSSNDLNVVAWIGNDYYQKDVNNGIFTLSSDTTAKIYLQVAKGSTKTYNDTVKFMLCEGIDTDWQPYNGEIVHEKELHETSIVRYGVALSDIANSYQSTWDELIKGNGFGNFYKSGVTFPSFLPPCPDDIWHGAGNIVEIGVKIKSNNFTSSMEFVLQGINQNNPAYKLDAYFDGTNWRNSGWYKPMAIELIYDMSSSDANINQGKTSGVQFNSSNANYVSNATTSKYEYFYVYVKLVNQIVCVKMKSGSNTSIMAQNYAQSLGTLAMGVLINSYDVIYAHDIRSILLPSGSFTTHYDNSDYVITKVEGVLL